MSVITFFSVASAVLVFCNGLILGNSNPPATALPTSSYQLLEALFIKERQTLSQYVATLEQRFESKDRALEQKLNQTLVEIENITLTLASEKSKRVQLQKDYDKLIVDFYDLSVEHVDLKINNQELVVNITKQDSEIKQLEEKIKNLTDSVDKLNVTAITTSHAGMLQPKNNTGLQVGFSADYPKDGSKTGTVRFSNVITNIGNDYNSASGVFTCDVPGLYFFSLVIYKTAYTDVGSCFIRHNQANKVEAFSSVPAPGGYFEASSSVVLHLKHGDTVDLAGCTIASSMEWLTTFSGFLINAD